MDIQLLAILTLLMVLGSVIFYWLIPAITEPSYQIELQRKMIVLALWWKIRTRYGTELGGFVHDTHVSAWISPNMCSYVTGTWIDAVGAVTGTVVKQCNAADQTSVIYIPISSALWCNSVALKGSYVTSIDIYYAVTTAALDAAGATALIDRFVLPANGAAFPTLVAHAFSYDTGNDTAGETDDLDEHTMTLTLTTPFWLDNDDLLQVRLTLDAAATSVIRFHGARVNATVKL